MCQRCEHDSVQKSNRRSSYLTTHHPILGLSTSTIERNLSSRANASIVSAPAANPVRPQWSQAIRIRTQIFRDNDEGFARSIWITLAPSSST
jgi:hypothetical protein